MARCLLEVVTITGAPAGEAPDIMAAGNDFDIEALRSQIAAENGFLLYRQYKEPEAAEIIGIHPATLKKLRLAGKIGFIRKGKRAIAYFGFQIADHLIESVQWPDAKAASPPSSSARPGSVGAGTPAHGTDTGGTQSEDARAALALARKTLKRPSSS